MSTLKCSKCNASQFHFYFTSPFYDVGRCLKCGYWAFTAIEDCCRNQQIIVAQDHKFPMQPRLYYQCLNCGGCLNRTKPLSFAKFGKDIEGEFSNHRFEEWITRRKAEAGLIAQELREYNYRNSKKFEYDQYIHSFEWKEKRKLVLERDKNMCRGCKANPAQEIHHLTYERLFNEPLDDLVG